jgi:hypothetical protein
VAPLQIKQSIALMLLIHRFCPRSTLATLPDDLLVRLFEFLQPATFTDYAVPMPITTKRDLKRKLKLAAKRSKHTTTTIDDNNDNDDNNEDRGVASRTTTTTTSSTTTTSDVGGGAHLFDLPNRTHSVDSIDALSKALSTDAERDGEAAVATRSRSAPKLGTRHHHVPLRHRHRHRRQHRKQRCIAQ